MRYPEYWIKIREKYPRFCAVQCKVCGMMVRGEIVWKIKTNNLTNRRANIEIDITSPVPVYYCKVCMPTKEKIINWVTNGDKEYYNLK